MTITFTRSHAVLFASGFALALLLSASPVKSLFGGGVPNSFVAGDVASADEVNENFTYLESQQLREKARSAFNEVSIPVFVSSQFAWESINGFTFTSPNSGLAQITVRANFDATGNHERLFRLTVNGESRSGLVGDDQYQLDLPNEPTALASASISFFVDVTSGPNNVLLEAMLDSSETWTVLSSVVKVDLLED